ncbi:MAG: ABC transporter ATP-binding protein [bacterium]
MIKVTNLTKRYGDFLALDGISFHISRGEIVGLLGPNGAGKTTTMNIITGYIPPTSGQAYIAGIDVSEDPVGVRRKIGYLPESTPLYNEMSIISYLRFVAEVRKINKSEINGKISEIIHTFGLENMLGKTIGQLSKGFRQRVGLAQAWIHEPDILILDEHTSGLDPKQQVEIRDLIRKIGEKRTVILSTHNLHEVQTTCDKLIIINQGRLIAQGKVEEIIAKSYPDEKNLENINLEDCFIKITEEQK